MANPVAFSPSACAFERNLCLIISLDRVCKPKNEPVAVVHCRKEKSNYNGRCHIVYGAFRLLDAVVFSIQGYLIFVLQFAHMYLNVFRRYVSHFVWSTQSIQGHLVMKLKSIQIDFIWFVELITASSIM